MAKTIIIPSHEKGGTLSQIAQKYNTSVQELMKLNPNITDPNKIFAGANLQVPDMSGTLNGPTSTPTGGKLPYDNTDPKEKILPDNGAGDNLSKFKELLGQIVKKNTLPRKEHTMDKFEEMGFDPNKVSGKTMAGVLGYIKDYSTVGAEDQYTEALSIIEDSMKRSQETIDKLISSGSIANIDDKTLAKLANIAGIDYDIIDSMRQAKKAEAKKPSSFTNIYRDGKQYRVGFDEMGNKISETPTGGTSTNKTGNSLNDLPDTEQAFVAEVMYKIQMGETNYDYLRMIDEYPQYTRFWQEAQDSMPELSYSEKSQILEDKKKEEEAKK